MKASYVVVCIAASLGLAVGFWPMINDSKIEFTADDHIIIKQLQTVGEIDSSNEVFRDIDEVCISNNADIKEVGKRTCETRGKVLALVKGASCQIISLEKLRAQILPSENTFECRTKLESFRIAIHKSDLHQILDFD